MSLEQCSQIIPESVQNKFPLNYFIDKQNRFSGYQTFFFFNVRLEAYAICKNIYGSKSFLAKWFLYFLIYLSFIKFIKKNIYILFA